MAATHTRQPNTTRQNWASGLTVFAAVMLMIGGVLAIFRGVMGIAEDDVFVTTQNYVFQFDLTGWGWLHLSLGIVAVLVSFGLLQNSTWARIVGVGIAAFILIANFLSLPYYPVWSVVMIAIAGFVIWALCVGRGREASAGYESERYERTPHHV
ncbi:DUF7144 family membrane protein [Streptomyces spongiae]|uniref:DUF7144 domain-containing protein n=1 Tax=Streptomyces spongiae TaxID=565072 RepID=A0A5N8XJ60_9ACTN|nr:hypothetical protein [Streptomyces spongiae]MPY58605.1 hypothetical protein [Streptomyces spongiae]